LIDTNILIYAINKDSPQHFKTAAFLEKILNGNDPWCLTWVNIYEFLRLTTDPRILSKPLSSHDAIEEMRKFLDHPRLEMLSETERHTEALRKSVAAAGIVRGIFFHDCHIAALLLEHDVRRIATADTDFRKFPFLDVMDPTRMTPESTL
jgi:hypothetical protein